MLVLALAFAVLVAVFAMQNATTVLVSFLAWEISTSLAVVILAAAALGALIAGSLGLVKQVEMRLRMRGLQGRIAKLQGELEALQKEKEALAGEQAKSGEVSE
jgi:uncharacterized integral membrane protein